MNFTGNSILVIGDLILDEYVRGTSTRMSPEAPVPVINIQGTPSFTYKLGGAGNVAANIASLGGKASIISVLGTSSLNLEVTNLLYEKKIDTAGLVHVRNRKTTVKTRILTNGQQIARLDSEDTHAIDEETQRDICRKIETGVGPCGAIILSDYQKGMLTPAVVQAACAAAGLYKIPLFIDPKTRNATAHTHAAADAVTVLTPNLREAEALNGHPIRTERELEDAGRYILARYKCRYLLITRGEDGISLFENSNSGRPEDVFVEHIPTEAKEVFDVSGAGDTVIAVLALGYASGLSMSSAARLANKAAGIVVGKSGTATVTAEELLR